MKPKPDFGLWKKEPKGPFYTHPEYKGCKLLSNQITPSEQLANFLITKKHGGMVICGTTGCGKTHVMGVGLLTAQMVGKLLPNDDKPFQLHNVFVLAPTNVVTKHRRLFNKIGIKNVEIITGD